MQHLVNAFWRTVYRLGYPCAQVVWRVTKKPGKGATIAVWHEGRLLCVRESYRPGLGLPGGGRLADETPEVTARRELFEEVGLDLAPAYFRPEGLIAFQLDGRPIEDALFEVELAAEAPLRIDQREIVWAGFLAPDDIREDRLQRCLRLYLERVEAREVALV
jgi:8-oxo-dGTP diphosphatase